MSDKPRRTIPVPPPPSPRVVAHAAPPVAQRHAAARAPRIHAPPPPAWPHRPPLQAKPAATPPATSRPGPPPPAFAAQRSVVQPMWAALVAQNLPPPKRERIATLRQAAGLQGPTVAATSAISTLWSWCHDEGELSYQAVANNEVEVASVSANLAPLLGAGARVELGACWLNMFDDGSHIVSNARTRYNNRRQDLSDQWDLFRQGLNAGLNAARLAGTTIDAYLTANGFGQPSPFGTRVCQLGGSYHATFTVFNQQDVNQAVTDMGALCRAGNLHVTYELHGADSPRNPHYYHNGRFAWPEGKNAYEEAERAILTTLQTARQAVKRQCIAALQEYL